jgi:hypothetical protein
LIGIFASNIVFKKMLNELQENDALNTKMSNYRSFLIIKYALLEGPALFAIIVTFITGNLFFLLYAGIMVLLLLYSRPKVQSAITDLRLNQQEMAIVEDPDGIIDADVNLN